MAIIATIHLPEGYDPREAVKTWWIWPEDNYGRAENVVAVQIEIADDLSPANVILMQRQKAQIKAIGTVDPISGSMSGWLFDGEGSVPAISVQKDKNLYGGYTVEELREIASVDDLKTLDNGERTQ